MGEQDEKAERAGGLGVDRFTNDRHARCRRPGGRVRTARKARPQMDAESADEEEGRKSARGATELGNADKDAAEVTDEEMNDQIPGLLATDRTQIKYLRE